MSFQIWKQLLYSITVRVRLKKINAMSQSSWQIGKPDLNAVFFNVFFFFLFFLSSRSVRFELVTALKYGTWFWMNKIQDRTQSWRSLLFRVFHYACHIFSCIFWQASSFKTGKKLCQQKKFKPWILLNQTRTEKQTRVAALRHRIYFF